MKNFYQTRVIYPPHVTKNLKNYAWKILILFQELIHLDSIQSNSIWWLDASVTVVSSRYETFLKFLKQATSSQSSSLDKSCLYFLPGPTTHGLAYATCNKTLKFLPTRNLKKWQNSPNFHMEQATSMLLVKNENFNCLQQIMISAYFCALDKNCIDPMGSKLICRSKNLSKNNWHPNDACHSACHRFDQSIFNLLIGNFYDYDKTKYTARGWLSQEGLISAEQTEKMRHQWQIKDLDLVFIQRT